MNYTINKLAKLSGVTVRTLRFYDEIGLLKPAYVAENDYRYYQEEELLLLQQILFFRELGFELKDIQNIVNQSDFNKLRALQAHKQVLRKNIDRMNELMNTIDKTILHLEEQQPMDEQAFFKGFSQEQQAKYEDYLTQKFGDVMKGHIAESKQNMKQWTKADWQAMSEEFDDICNELVILLQKKLKPTDPKVQVLIRRHYHWIQKFWKPNRDSYRGLALGYLDPAWEKTFSVYHPQLAQFLVEAMNVFAEKELS